MFFVGSIPPTGTTFRRDYNIPSVRYICIAYCTESTLQEPFILAEELSPAGSSNVVGFSESNSIK
jgi:hypothetical protein